MKISISGPANSGKTTLINEFINKWKNYKTPIKSYRDELAKQKLTHSKQTSEETQSFILDFMIKQLEENKNYEHIIYDRCPLDVLVYTVQAAEQGLVSDNFVSDTILKVRDSLSLLDIIFVLPYNKNIPIEKNGVRETDLDYILKTDNIFKNLLNQYFTDFDSNIFFPRENCPGIVPLESDKKIIEISGIINKNGDLYTPEDDITLQKNLSEAISASKKNKDLLEKLISSQQTLASEKIQNLNIY